MAQDESELTGPGVLLPPERHEAIRDDAARPEAAAMSGEVDAQIAASPAEKERLGLSERLAPLLGSRVLPVGIVFLTAYIGLFWLYRPDLLFSLTTTAGGDTGAHHYPARYLIDYLLPNGKVTGWAPGWYAGMPMLTFYFPFPFLLIALFNVFLPYQLAFKLITAAGVFLLPLAAYAFGRLFRLRPPFPLLAAAFAVLFLLMESYSIYGANILSTLAGEFGFSLSFALTFVFLGMAHRGMERGRIDWWLALTGLLLGALVLSHLVTTLALIFITPSLLVLHRNLRSFFWLAAVFLLGFCLQAFWGLPFLDKLEWTAHMSWNQLTAFDDLLPQEIRIVAALGVVGMAYALAKRDLRTFPMFWTVLVLVVLFYALPDGRLWNARLLPFFYFTVHLWAAYGVAWLLRPFLVIADDLLSLPDRVSARAYAPLVGILVVVIAVATSTTAAGWIRWNYSGYEGKDGWPQYQEILDFIDEQPPGRVMVEHNQKIDRFGTPRAFEIIPYWAEGHDTMEGTLMEAAFTAPYHFINQAELSVEPSHAIVGVEYPPRNTGRGISHLQLMNIPYLITVSPEVTGEVNADPRADLLTKIDEFSIFKIAGTGGYVEVAANQPQRLVTGDWRTPVVDWYTTDPALDVPLVWDRGEAGVEQFPEIAADAVTNPPREPLSADGAVISEQFEEEKLTFETSAIGVPHLIKISYFPNWQVEGAEGPYVASPSFMMVVPTQREVTLSYGSTASNTVGQTLTGLGLLAILGILAFSLWRRNRGPRPETDNGFAPDKVPGEDAQPIVGQTVL